MPIGDLLAQISGNKATSSPAPVVRRPSLAPGKRKADEDLRDSASKTPRFTPPTRTYERPTNGASTRPATVSSKPLNNGQRVSQPVAPLKKPPPPPPSSESAKPKGPPKKGSYAEILARAQRAQAVMGQVGKIQHKKVEKGAGKKDGAKDDAVKKPATTEKPATTAGKRPTVSGYSGTAKPGQQRPGAANGVAAAAPVSKVNRNGHSAQTKPSAAGKKTADVEVVKKIKKAAAATTGYTGTARPRPGDAAKKGNAPRGGALLNAPPPRAGSSKRSRFQDEYDEDLDDFIDYDDEEEEGGPRFDYASDASSDMEAGMDDIDDEERRAEHIGRLEDLREERLEKSLKSAKEEKKRKALDILRNKRR